ncbi:radical SAM protein [Candidatus Woesearchaeota archaeon]|nr:radical SAM protein [Candidatus Woesearchaeota archaeon]
MRIIPEIPLKVPTKFQEGFQNTFPYWGFFSQEQLEANGGKLLMLDLDIGGAGRYCSLDCPDCFRKDNVVDDSGGKDLSDRELTKVIDEACDLGLQSIKICGVGEPTENSRFLHFVQCMTERDIGVAVFTKGQVLGDDEKARTFNKRDGIGSAEELCKAFYDLKVSFMLGFHSFDTEIQDRKVQHKGYTLIRNRALENLVQAGFTVSNPPRLAFCNAPVVRETYADAFDIYVYARKRNIYPITAVEMTSGKQLGFETGFWAYIRSLFGFGSYVRRVDITKRQKVKLWTKIYSWNIEHGLQTLKQIREEGISCLPGGHPCNQLRAGLYVTAKGNVIGCPGFTNIQGNVRQQSLREIWERSSSRVIAAERFNTGCPPKEGKTIPADLYTIVLQNLEEKYS